jgi:hypothetical protein
MFTELITRRTLADGERSDFVHRLFGLAFPFKVEPTIFDMAGMLAADYRGGFWLFHSLSNGGFYMAPDAAHGFKVSCANGFEGELTSDALGITASLYAYSQLSFSDGQFAEVCASQYHLLRSFAMDHAEASAILAACD